MPNYEEKYPGDMRPRNAIEVARRYAQGEATPEEIRAARDAARAAARAAAWAADSVLEQIFIQWLEENSSMEEK